MKRALMFLVALVCVSVWAEGVVRNVTLRQIQPWNGLVEIGYELTETIVAPEGKCLGTTVTITDKVADHAYTAKTFTTEPSYTAGTHRLIWNAQSDGVAFVSTNAVAAVTVFQFTPKYCVIDLSGGTTATSYPVTYLVDVPSGGWTDDYKTTKLVLRKIEAGTDPLNRYTLTKDFWAGVFEVTQKQWLQVMGSWPGSSPSSSYGSGDAYPAYDVSYNDIRGSSAGAGWPSSSSVDATSFIGRLRAKTGITALDLPTEAQWEYACRAGTTTTYSYGDSVNGDYMWYSDNSGSKSHPVGTKKPNPLGLYDVHGNVWEWCLDWYGASLSGNDPVGAASGSNRRYRGGSWLNSADYCTSSNRSGDYPDYRCIGVGFRLFWTLP